MKLSHFVALILWSSFFLIFCSTGFTFSPVYFDSNSFKVTGHSRGKYEFFIYENNTSLYITFFLTTCMGPPVIYGAGETIFPEKFKIVSLYDEQVEPANYIAASVNVTYESLDAGSYTLSLYQNPEVCVGGDVALIGNTGRHDINPCKYLFLYPYQQPKFAHSYSENEFLVVAPPNCPWVAVKQDAWITISPNTLNWGSGIVHHSVSENQTQKPRNGSILVYNEVFRIEQEAMPIPGTAPSYLPYIPLLLKSESK